ncbi:MAG: hypothetical protein RMK29_13515 [Myxococcales bacterium]|nr:hypothetical protein [Myxococcota bacterium]MDW8282726.1 hypothetical protein [Myxococcales bacterium]
MIAKGYDPPLYSLDLVPAEAPPPAGGLGLPVAEGVLVAPPRLLGRALHVCSLACEQAVSAALAVHAQAEAGFGLYGLDGAWARAMRHWADRLLELEQERMVLVAEQGVATGRRRELLHRAAALRGHLQLVAKLAGVGRLLLPEGRPQALLAVLDSLQQVRLRLADAALRQQLQPFGLREADLRELDALVEGLSAERAGTVPLAQAQRRLAGAIQVLRAGLLGDLGRLGRVAPLVLPPDRAAELQRQRLFGPLRPAPARPPAPRSPR